MVTQLCLEKVTFDIPISGFSMIMDEKKSQNVTRVTRIAFE